MSIPTQRVREQTTSIVSIPMTNEDGDALSAASLTTLTATMTSLDTGAAVFTDRDVKASLTAGVLALELTPADLTMLTSRSVERRVVTLSATYGSGKAWHVEVPLEVTNLIGVA
jgi:hypothetical protein